MQSSVSLLLRQGYDMALVKPSPLMILLLWTQSVKQSFSDNHKDWLRYQCGKLQLRPFVTASLITAVNLIFSLTVFAHIHYDGEEQHGLFKPPDPWNVLCWRDVGIPLKLQRFIFKTACLGFHLWPFLWRPSAWFAHGTPFNTSVESKGSWKEPFSRTFFSRSYHGSKSEISFQNILPWMKEKKTRTSYHGCTDINAFHISREVYQKLPLQGWLMTESQPEKPYRSCCGVKRVQELKPWFSCRKLGWNLKRDSICNRLHRILG